MASWLVSLDIGLISGLMFAWPVLALACSFRLLNFPDLTVEGSIPTGAAVLAVTLAHGWSPWAGVGAAMLAGAALGCATGSIHAYLNVNKFLAGILVVAMSYTLDLRIMDAPNIGLVGSPTVFDALGHLNEQFPSLQAGALVLLATLLIVGVAFLLLLARSRLGLQMRVSGSNPTFGRAIGLNTRARLCAGLGLTNSLAAGGGALIAMYQGFADVGMGQGGLILALASMTIGERLVPQRRLSITSYVLLSAVLGAIVYQVLVALALRAGLAASDLKLVTAAFVLVIIALRLRQRDDNFLEAAT